MTNTNPAMKPILSTLLASIAITLTAAASPSLRIESTIATDGEHIVSRPTIIVQSGEQAIISSGDQESELTCALTPTLLDNGTVDIRVVITQRKGKKTDTLANPRIKVQLGELAKIQSGKLVFTAKPSLAKVTATSGVKDRR